MLTLDILNRYEALFVNADTWIIGWDYDHKKKSVVKAVMKKAATIGHPTLQDSKKGYHIKIRLDAPITLYRSFQIRYWLKDDWHRLAHDMMFAMGGSTRVYDVLFDVKKIKKRRIFE